MSQAFDDNTGMPRSLNDIGHTVKTLWLFVRRAAKAVAKGLANVLTKGLTKPVVRRDTTRESKESRAMATVHITVAMQATDSAYAAALGRAATRSYQALIFLLAAFNGWPT